mmetsp:Transcript_128336/g.256323  ORF Transcript_128336/g.256323 Transcript_128336/m.256323 type:complete len:359 (+) Transcript_128336:188-1264(+)
MAVLRVWSLRSRVCTTAVCLVNLWALCRKQPAALVAQQGPARSPVGQLVHKPSLQGSSSQFNIKKYGSLTMASTATYLAQSDTWHLTHSPRTYKMSDTERTRFAQDVATALVTSTKPLVVFVGRDNLPEFLAASAGKVAVPFVLVVAGNDSPLTQVLQSALVEGLPTLRACFSPNLHSPLEPARFHPLPVGFLWKRMNADHECFVRELNASAAPFEERDMRLLVPWMRHFGGLRPQYARMLATPEYHALVKVVPEKMSFREYMTMVSQHRAVLSPPGKGYDCTRTWEAISVGSMPLILNNPAFDQRIYVNSQVQFIPAPEELTPAVVQHILEKVHAPAEAGQLDIQTWVTKWRHHLRD